MSKTITVKKAKEAIQNLRKLTPANPKLDDDLEMTAKEAVFLLAPELVQMTKRGFTVKELSEGLAVESVHIKPGTLNRYLNEYLLAKENLVKSNTSLEGSEKDVTPASDETEPQPEALTAETTNEETGSANLKPAKGNPTSGGKTAGEKSNSPANRRDTSDSANKE